MPSQSEINHNGPQNICSGSIKLNEVEVHSGWARFTADTVGQWHSEIDYQSITDIHIGVSDPFGLFCTSSDVLNSVFYDLGRIIDEMPGLKSLTIEMILDDQNKLEEWSLGELALKTHSLQHLKIANLGMTTEDNRSQLLEFAALAVSSSACLQTLHIEGTCSNAVDGGKFMQVLADDRCDSLQNLTIADERAWFENGRDDCKDSLVTIIARQAELKLLDLHDNGFTEEQEQQIRSAAANPECRLIVNEEEFKAYETEQKQTEAAANEP